MDKWAEINPDNGIKETFGFDDETGKVHVYQEKDVTALLEQCTSIRNQGLADKGIKKNWWPWAKLDLTQVYFLMEKGYNIFDKNLSTKDLERAINHYFPYNRLTDKNVA